MIIKDYGFDDPQKRNETLELIKKVVNDHKNNLKLELTVKALSMIGTLIEKQEQIIEDQEERIAIMSVSGLLPISEKKPPYDKDVLLYLKSGEYFVGHRENHYGQDVYCDGELGGGYVHPTHWMYLPKPPKGEEI